MRKNRTKILSCVFALVASFSTLSACVDPEKPLPEAYKDYKKETGNVMFWEKEDQVLSNTIEPNIDIHIYNYCPTIIQTDATTRYAYYCSNRYSSNTLKEFEWLGVSLTQKGKYHDYFDEIGDNRITDYVACRKGILHNGEWYWSDKSYVLGPTEGSLTEGEQTCDPNVIKGEFYYDGKTYPYLMNYLACSTRDNTFNHVCLAVAEDPMGPWIKCDKVAPLREFTIDGVPEYMLKTYLWGYGQASMISVDKKGRVLMFYSTIAPTYNESGDYWQHVTRTTVERWDLSNIENPVMEFRYDSMPVKGLQRYDEQIGTVTNGDYAYDPTTNRIYCVLDGSYDSRKQAPSGAPVGYVENKSRSANPEIGDLFKDFVSQDWGSQEGKLQWSMVGYAHLSDYQNYTTTHNNAIIRDEYGYLTDTNKIEVALTGALTTESYLKKYPNGKGSDYLWSYRIQRVTLDIARTK